MKNSCTLTDVLWVCTVSMYRGHYDLERKSRSCMTGVIQCLMDIMSRWLCRARCPHITWSLADLTLCVAVTVLREVSADLTYPNCSNFRYCFNTWSCYNNEFSRSEIFSMEKTQPSFHYHPTPSSMFHGTRDWMKITLPHLLLSVSPRPVTL